MTELDLQNPQFNPGGLPHIPKASDLQWKDVGAATEPFVWEQGFDIEAILKRKLPVKNQFQSGSCGGQETSQYDGVLEAVSTGTFEERSAKDVIAQTFVLSPEGVMLGSTFEANSQLAVKSGVSREALCPSYDANGRSSDAFMNRPEDITEAARADAKLSKARSYAFVPPTIDDFAQAASINYGIGFLIRGSNNGTWLSANPQPGAGTWGHFLYGGKFVLINGKKTMIAIESWGEEVGDHGWQSFGEEWFASGLIKVGRTFVFDDAAPIPQKYTFTRDLTVGSHGVDVKFLQRFLNTHGAPLAESGPGSLNNETAVFGPLSQQAVSKFQRDHGISPTLGYFGPLTRKVVNAMN